MNDGSTAVNVVEGRRDNIDTGSKYSQKKDGLKEKDEVCSILII